jgi:hypothetical protein
MTDGEKMVWAAVFALEFQETKHPPSRVLTPDKSEEWAEWERDIVSSAIERAGIAVRYLREAEKRIADGYGPSETEEFYKAMMGK